MPRSLALLRWSPARTPEAARIDRQALVQPELGREIGDRPRPQDRSARTAPHESCVLQVLGESAERVIDSRVERHLGRSPLELLDRQALEELDRVVIDLPPERRVQLAKQGRSRWAASVHQRFRASSRSLSTNCV